MPLPPDPRFAGREAELRLLAALLKAPTAPPVAAITGPPGIGKTRLAAEFVHRYGGFFSGGAFWLSFGDGEDVAGQVALCGGLRALALREDFDDLPQAVQIELVRHAWAGDLPRLLVFDDCEDEALLARWLPRSGGSRVLIAGRKADWPTALAQVVKLESLSPRASVALLRRRRPELAEDDGNLRAIAQELGGLPLALRLAASYLGRLRYEPLGLPASYLAELRQMGSRSPEHFGAGQDGPATQAARAADCFILGFRRLDPGDPIDAKARTALLCAGCFAPGLPIPRGLLWACLRLDEEDEDASRIAEEAFLRAVEFGLLEPCADDALCLHPLLAGLPLIEAAEAMTGALEGVERAVLAEANRLNQLNRPAALAAWQPHLRAVVAAAYARDSLLAAPLLSALGTHLNMIGEKRAALAAFERALRISIRILGQDHPTIATRLNNMGVILRDLGELEAARASFESAIEMDENAHGPNHPTVASGLGNLGSVRRALGDLQGAREAYKRALKIDERAFGAAHPSVALRLSSLGGVLRALGDLPGARSAHERALRIDEMVLGPRHPHLAICLSNLGVVLQDLGMNVQARSALERAIRIEAAQGAAPPHLAVSLSNLAVVLVDMGEHAAARSALERALAIAKAHLPAGDRSLAVINRNLERLPKS